MYESFEVTANENESGEVLKNGKDYGAADCKMDTKQNANLVYSVDDAVNKVGYGKFQLKLTLLAGLGWLADAFEIFILSIIGDFMACDWTLFRWQIALLTSIVFAGIMVGSPVLGAVADVYGRKRSLAVSSILLFLFGAVSAASPSFIWMVIFRSCMGFSLGGIAQGVTLNSEYCPTNVRGRAGFFICYFWSLGSLGVVLLMWLVMEFIGSWRILLLFASVPCLIVIMSLKWYPESARFYLVSDQRERAVKILEIMATTNYEELPPGELTKVGLDFKRGRLQDLLGKEYRKTSLLFWYIWFATAFSYFGICLLSPLIVQKGSLMTDYENGTFMQSMTDPVPCATFTRQNYIDMLWTSAAEFPGLIVFTFLVEHVRRKLLLSSACVASSLSIMLLLLKTHKAIILSFLFAARAILCAIFQLNYIMTSEAYPTTIRAVGMGTGTAFCRLGGLIVPYVAQVLVIEQPVVAICLLGGLVLMASVAAAFLPFETKGIELKESHSG
ncbi:synaptic vesicle 2-related protein-like [Argiope bruennichi]|uniref:Synaptic vesicle 2-related protein like n=1 Tax=Argiope bruennichi TaxID=94029 RepID=A0A8T0FQF2_ARGBR|nr:synaptic vesicle 2-related protein-like [Argiope bruennichi]KAF8793341.1 Synaptic vesicle 2-related protein like [Argiope bruennichi]